MSDGRVRDIFDVVELVCPSVLHNGPQSVIRSYRRAISLCWGGVPFVPTKRQLEELARLSLFRLALLCIAYQLPIGIWLSTTRPYTIWYAILNGRPSLRLDMRLPLFSFAEMCALVI